MICLLCNILIFVAIGVLAYLIHRYIKLSLLQNSVLICILLVVWNLCALSIVANVLYIVALLCLCVVAYNKKNIKSVVRWGSLIAICTSALLLVRGFADTSVTSASVSEKQIEDSVSFISDEYVLSDGVRMGDGYKADYCALQACVLYKGELYQFFNKGYYEVRDTSSMKLVREGKLNIPVDIHFGSVAFSDKAESDCTIPYLYATDDAGREGCVYCIDFERQKVVSNYNINGGSIAAFDFENRTGYVVSTSDMSINVKKFDMESGSESGSFAISINAMLMTMQTVIYRNGMLYVLSGDTGKSLILTEVDILKQQAKINNFPFKGEPEGLFFKDNGDIVVTANLGNWSGGRNSKDYIHSEYFILRKK